MYNLVLGILSQTCLWNILVFVFQIQYIHRMSMGYDHIAYMLNYIWTSLEILTYTRDMPRIGQG